MTNFDVFDLITAVSMVNITAEYTAEYTVEYTAEYIETAEYTAEYIAGFDGLEVKLNSL